MQINFEIKARYDDLDKARSILKKIKAVYIGSDHQIDTYFQCQRGRLKLREGNIENSFVFYKRQDQTETKRSEVYLHTLKPHTAFKDILDRALGVKVIVDKIRDIYFIDNVKIHLDQVRNLGSFIEIEAIGIGRETPDHILQDQCESLCHILMVEKHNLLSGSYSDMLQNLKSEG
ncbi:MAG: class IV adenylate cyclase [Candidatus Cloacimonetes bacterium]|nr:class IV adenylate cyclase [Candidatus Cloacimonadota bacterium]